MVSCCQLLSVAVTQMTIAWQVCSKKKDFVVVTHDQLCGLVCQWVAENRKT